MIVAQSMAYYSYIISNSIVSIKNALVLLDYSD